MSDKYAEFWRDWFVLQEIPDRHGKTQKIYYQFFNLMYIYRRVFSSLFESVYFNANFKKIDPKTKEKIGPELKRVPMEFTTKNKIAQYRTQTNVAFGETLTIPKIGIAPVGFEYDPDRSRTPIPKMIDTEYLDPIKRSKLAEVLRSYIPKPFVQKYIVTIVTNELSVQDQILEQVIPQLVPEMTFDINIPLFTKYTTRINFEGINKEYTFETDFDHDRSMVMSLDFSQKIILFPPIKDEMLISEIISTYGIHKDRLPENWEDNKFERP